MNMLNEVNYKILSVVGQRIVDDPEIRRVLARMNRDPYLLAPESELRGDREFMLFVVRQYGAWALRYASAELQGDREIVLAAVRQNGWSLYEASAELQGDREIVLAAVRSVGRLLIFLSDELQGDREIVLAAVNQDCGLLEHASAECKGDREIVLSAVRQNGKALRYASAERKGDRKIVLAAVRQNGKALQYASAELKDDLEIVLTAVSKTGRALRYASETLKNGGLRSYVEKFIVQYNVSKQTFVATILFGARQALQSKDQESTNPDSRSSHSGRGLRLLGPSSKEGDDFSTHAKRLICAYAGVRLSKRDRDIELVARRLKVDVPGSKPHNVCCTVS